MITATAADDREVVGSANYAASIAEYVARCVAVAPLLSTAQRARIAVLLAASPS